VNGLPLGSHFSSQPCKQTLVSSHQGFFAVVTAGMKRSTPLVILSSLGLAALGFACLVWTGQAQAQGGGSQLSLSALYAGENKPISRGLIWRVFRQDSGKEPERVAQSTDNNPIFPLPPGEYVIHVSYGLASSSRKVLVGSGTTTERVPIAAGALIVRGSILDQIIPINRLQVSIYIPQPGNSEGRLVTSSLRTGEIVRLPEGSYHVVSSYEDSNSIVRADIRVSSGKITEATMHHRAATITLKLVSNAGGEARANTAWSVLTPGGDAIRESIGAFPSMTLAEGDYVAIARNDGQVYQHDFKIRSGMDRDVEVLAQGGQPATNASSPQTRPTRTQNAPVRNR
jgi:hypothetical protein